MPSSDCNGLLVAEILIAHHIYKEHDVLIAGWCYDGHNPSKCHWIWMLKFVYKKTNIAGWEIHHRSTNIKLTWFLPHLAKKHLCDLLLYFWHFVFFPLWDPSGHNCFGGWQSLKLKRCGCCSRSSSCETQLVGGWASHLKHTSQIGKTTKYCKDHHLENIWNTNTFPTTNTASLFLRAAMVIRKPILSFWGFKRPNFQGQTGEFQVLFLFVNRSMHGFY